MYFNQRGATLLISLILLLLFTIIGMASVNNIGFNQKMSSNYRDADLTFHAAEAVLREGEGYVDTIAPGVYPYHFEPVCDEGDCFTADCGGGRCFSGTYSDGVLCDRVEPAPPYAEQDDIWSSSTSSRTSELDFPGLLERPKYFIEFMCYVSRDENASLSPDYDYPSGEWSYLFRVTSYAQGANGNSRVMLQSTYKVDQF